jgi:hypothetical protein
MALLIFGVYFYGRVSAVDRPAAPNEEQLFQEDVAQPSVRGIVSTGKMEPAIRIERTTC